jgi:hypothetical protein
MKEHNRKHKAKLLFGDVVEQALGKVGITSDRIESWLGFRCKCKERRDKLNRLDAWARQLLFGKKPATKEHLEQMIEDDAQLKGNEHEDGK